MDEVAGEASPSSLLKVAVRGEPLPRIQWQRPFTLHFYPINRDQAYLVSCHSLAVQEYSKACNYVAPEPTALSFQDHQTPLSQPPGLGAGRSGTQARRDTCSGSRTSKCLILVVVQTPEHDCVVKKNRGSRFGLGHGAFTDHSGGEISLPPHAGESRDYPATTRRAVSTMVVVAPVLSDGRGGRTEV